MAKYYIVQQVPGERAFRILGLEYDLRIAKKVKTRLSEDWRGIKIVKEI